MFWCSFWEQWYLEICFDVKRGGLDDTRLWNLKYNPLNIKYINEWTGFPSRFTSILRIGCIGFVLKNCRWRIMEWDFCCSWFPCFIWLVSTMTILHISCESYRIARLTPFPVILTNSPSSKSYQSIFRPHRLLSHFLQMVVERTFRVGRKFLKWLG
jgi:hypothetical protein